MDANIVTIICAVIGSGALSTLIAQLISHHDKKLERKNGANKAIRMILKDRIRYLCEKYVAQGWIYASDLEELLNMHDCYHTDLEGNGFLTAFISKVKALPVKADPKK